MLRPLEITSNENDIPEPQSDYPIEPDSVSANDPNPGIISKPISRSKREAAEIGEVKRRFNLN